METDIDTQVDLPQRHQRHLWRWAFLDVRWPCSFWLILWVFDGLVTQCSQKSSCCGHFYHCFYLQGVDWAQRKTQGAAQRQTLLTLPSRFQIELTLLLSQDPPTPPAGLHSSQGRRALLLSPVPPGSSLPHQFPTPADGKNRRLLFSPGCFYLKRMPGRLMGHGAGVSVTWRGWSVFHISVRRSRVKSREWSI